MANTHSWRWLWEEHSVNGAPEATVNTHFPLRNPEAPFTLISSRCQEPSIEYPTQPTATLTSLFTRIAEVSRARRSADQPTIHIVVV